MTTYTITADGRMHLPDRDAYAVTVRVDREGADLGLWQTWISGMADVEIDRQAQPSITQLQRRHIAAELLADTIEAEARAGRLRDAWQIDVAVLEPTTASAVIGNAANSPRPAPDFRDGEVVRTFET